VQKFQALIRLLESYSDTRALFDVCCGVGGLMYLAKQRGWDYVLGCELNTGHVQYALEEFGIEILYGEFEDVVHEPEFGAVVFHHGIEHCRFPKRCVRKALDILVPGGVVYFGHPNSETVEEMEKAGHVHEWSHASFEYFLKQFPELSLVSATEPDSKPAQSWLLKKGFC
jgi:SAM-dependent methyltransferase